MYLANKRFRGIYKFFTDTAPLAVNEYFKTAVYVRGVTTAHKTKRVG